METKNNSKITKTKEWTKSKTKKTDNFGLGVFVF
jgi:hypothetical protein